ncbi:ArnT family glycosyltransferase [Demequina mangrovi]|uniref:Dolichyl-phosphate-mannose-protein mannosyltransferase n=1 Tax=Demequina mangrovi TaxID=1043493 RepID=A0A1H6TEM5_9MICO|nr:glycosyltransferase family 39 protein [Demequina mangrovi]SEI78508.1 Dolichyl-phosphate-mannose-protein mannosyltransferase [Demequina mangrovi]
MTVTHARRAPLPSEWIGIAEEWAVSFKDSRRSRLGVLALYLAVAAAIVVPVVLGPGGAMSRIDEPTHADYAWRASHLEIPYAGSIIAPEIRDIWACVGQERYELPACGAEAQAWEFPYEGQQYNFSHPPLYYLVVGLPARAIDAALPSVDFLTAARLPGVLWLGLGMFTMFVALRRWRVDPAAAIIAPLLLPAFPRVLHAVTTVNPDAATVVIGASAVWLAARIFVDEDADWRIAALLAGVAAMTKTIAAIPFIALGALLTFRMLRDWAKRREHGRDAAIVGAMAGAILLPYIAWQAWQSGRGDPNWQNPLVGLNTRDVLGLPGSEWLETLFLGFNLASDYYLQEPLNVALMISWTRLLNVLVIGAIFAVIVACAKEPARRSLGWMVLAGTVLYPTVVQIQAYLSTAVPQYFPNPTGRYGLALIPGAVACIVIAAWKAGYRRLVYILALVGLVVLGVVITNGFRVM